MHRYIVLDKKVGETPLMAIHKWRLENPELKDVPASYAGRLDPMASGKLLVLLGDECKRQREYTKLDKEYEVEILLGVGSDTGDVLGLVSKGSAPDSLLPEKITDALKKELGAHTREYPVYSSKTVRGKQLFLYALTNTLNTITIPTHVETMHKITQLKIARLSPTELRERIESTLALVPKTTEPSKALGEDFRIEAVRKSWDAFFTTAPEHLTLITVRVTCGSGAYMRSLAGRVGESLGTKGLALSIRRTKLGTFVPLFSNTGFWLRTY